MKSTPATQAPPELEYTAERMLPEASALMTFWEHVLRYRFVLPHVRGKRVLDIACGEGYGARALQNAGARQVLGMDVSASAARHAHRRYGLTVCRA